MNEATKEQIYRVVTDRRLKGIDVKVYMYMLSRNGIYFKQEYLADLLDVTKDNLNRSIQKLKALGYITLTKHSGAPIADYFYILCIDYKTNEEIEVKRKAKSNNVTYSVTNKIKTNFTLEQFMELCNIDIKTSSKKFRLEDSIDCNVKGDGKFILDLVTVKKKSDVDDLYILYKFYYKELYSENLPANYYENNNIDIKDVLLFISNICHFKGILEDDRIVDIINNFKRKYLNKMISYYMQNNILDEEFFMTYNTLNKEEFKDRDISCSHLMKVLGIANRDTTPVIDKFKLTLTINSIEHREFYSFTHAIQIIKKISPDCLAKDAVFNLDIEKLESIYEEFM